MDFLFDKTPWDSLLESVKPGDAISALQCLTVLEELSEEEAEDALLALEEQDVVLDISDLPKCGFTGEAAIRLQLEQKLSESGQLVRGLEENDPLRVYLEEVASTPAFGNEDQLAVDAAKGDESATQK